MKVNSTLLFFIKFPVHFKYNVLKTILDSESSEKYIDLTMMFFLSSLFRLEYNLLFLSFHNISPSIGNWYLI